MDLRASDVPPVELSADAWVVAPHPDDETLGCGGTIAEKSRRGARVRVVFVSDGSESHAQWMDKGDLAKRRTSEGRQACARLGVRPEDVHFLGLPDGDLSAHVEAGGASLARLFSEHSVKQFFIPHRLEPPADHAAATAMAIAGLREAGCSGTLFEYPVWMWARWPWTPTGSGQGGFWELIRELRWRVDVRSQVEVKRQALACHETQTVRLLDAPDWPVLADLAGGEFLACFFSGAEYFHRSVLSD